jgi:hypothetical protein
MLTGFPLSENDQICLEQNGHDLRIIINEQEFICPYVTLNKLKYCLNTGRKLDISEEIAEILARIYLGILVGKLKPKIVNYPQLKCQLSRQFLFYILLNNSINYTNSIIGLNLCLLIINLSVKIEYLQTYLQLYLFPCCYHSSKKIGKKIGQILSLQRRYQTSDYFVIAWEKLSCPAVLLKNFGLDSTFLLKAYTAQALYYGIRDRIYQENKELIKLKYQGYPLLYDGGKKEMQYALASYFSEPKNQKIAYGIWQILLDIYSPEGENGRFIEAKSEDFLIISERYNLRKPKDFPAKNSEEVKVILEQCIEALSNWRKTRESYPDSEYSDNSTAEKYWHNLINESQIELDIYTRIEDPIFIYLKQVFEDSSQDKNYNLSAQEKAILSAYYGLNLTLDNIAKLMGNHQCTVTRKRQEAMEKLLRNYFEIWDKEDTQKLNEDQSKLIRQALIPSRIRNNQEPKKKKQIYLIKRIRAFIISFLMENNLDTLALTFSQKYLNNAKIKTIKDSFEDYLFQLCSDQLYQITKNVLLNQSSNSNLIDENLKLDLKNKIFDYFVHNLPIKFPNNNIETIKIIEIQIIQLITDWYILK